MEAVPEDTSRVLDNANVGRDISFVVLNQRDSLVLPGLTEEAPKVVETGEPPVSLFGSESVSRNWTKGQLQLIGPVSPRIPLVSDLP